MSKEVEAELFAELGEVLDCATASGVSWAKIYGVLSTLLKVAEHGLIQDLNFHKEKSNEPTA